MKLVIPVKLIKENLLLEQLEDKELAKQILDDYKLSLFLKKRGKSSTEISNEKTQNFVSGETEGMMTVSGKITFDYTSEDVIVKNVGITFEAVIDPEYKTTVDEDSSFEIEISGKKYDNYSIEEYPSNLIDTLVFEINDPEYSFKTENSLNEKVTIPTLLKDFLNYPNNTFYFVIDKVNILNEKNTGGSGQDEYRHTSYKVSGFIKNTDTDDTTGINFEANIKEKQYKSEDYDDDMGRVAVYEGKPEIEVDNLYIIYENKRIDSNMLYKLTDKKEQVMKSVQNMTKDIIESFENL